MKWFIVEFVLSFIGFTFAMGVLYPMIGKMVSKDKEFVSEYDVGSVLRMGAIAALATTLLELITRSV